jgi:hypothetical protein
MTTTATRLVHTSSRDADNALRIARVLAAGRLAAQRQAAAARLERERRELHAVVTAWVEEIRALGAVEVGCKITLSEGGKWRLFVPIDAAAAFLTRQIRGAEDVEANGRDASGEFVGACL